MLLLVRGLPNSGKTTFANLFAEKTFSADHWFEAKANEEQIGYAQAFEKYRDKIHIAHRVCQNMTEEYLKSHSNISIVAVTNTFSTKWELEPYLKMAEQHNHLVFVIEIERHHDGDNRHMVPNEAVAKMVKRWQKMDPRWTS